MSTENQVLSYGQYLKAIRLERGIRLEEVSAETRIGRDILLSIENEDEATLPAEVFVKGFMRAYADVIGADGEEAVRKFCSTRKVVQETSGSQKLYVHPRRRLWPMLLAIFMTLAVLVSVSIYLTREDAGPRIDNAPPPPSAKKPPEIKPARKPTVEKTVPEKVPEPSLETVQPIQETDGRQAAAGAGNSNEPVSAAKEPSAPADSGKLILAVATREETWMKVIVDGGKPKEYTLAAGDRLALEGRVNFNLLIGNAGGIELTYNGRVVEVPGKSGQVVTLQLP